MSRLSAFLSCATDGIVYRTVLCLNAIRYACMKWVSGKDKLSLREHVSALLSAKSRDIRASPFQGACI